MAANAGSYGIVAKRYAAALLDMAAEARAIEHVDKDMRDLAAMLQNAPDLQSLIENPLISREQQLKAVQALAERAKFQTLTANFLGVLAQNRRLPALGAVIGAFQSELRRRRGEVEAKVETAFALNPAQTNALQEQLSKAMGTNVTLNVEVNRDLLGGLVVTVGSRMIDDSVRRKLEKLQRTMNSGEKAA